LGGFRRTLKMLSCLPVLKRWSKVKMGDFASRFRNPFLRRAFLHVMYDIPGNEVPMMALLLFMAGLENGDLGWPSGGSLAFSRKIEKRFGDLGGKVHYRAKVEKILVENDQAVGVRLQDGSEHQADRVISAADGYSTIFGLLEGRYVNAIIQKYYEDSFESGPFGINLFLGLEGELSGKTHALTLLFDEPLDLGDIEQDSLHLVTFGPETGLVPAGKSVLKVEGQAKYSFWKQRRDGDMEAYRTEKNRVAERIIDRIAKRFPGLRDRIEVMDVSTLPTAERFTGNRHGAQPGPPKKNTARIARMGLSKTLPGLGRFHMVGHWATATIGVSTVAVMGRNLIRELCKRDGKRFIGS
ncbi:MAG: NAD(P)/FAD-dependent oxidoreductase, partial [Candidatus Aminicenantes bacterium]|nr:NAD(P)/FAD-dependent oxidoreductase [Candidatus Aminicenantes bacterium]